jgi:hypothetical protein
MSFLKRIFKPREVQIVLKLLDEAELSVNSPAFSLIKKHIKTGISKFPDKIVENLKESQSPQQIVYLMIANTAGDQLETGIYHMYRGVLNPLDSGPELLRIYNFAIDELVRIGYMSEKEAEENRSGLHENIRNVG